MVTSAESQAKKFTLYKELRTGHQIGDSLLFLGLCVRRKTALA